MSSAEPSSTFPIRVLSDPSILAGDRAAWDDLLRGARRFYPGEQGEKQYQTLVGWDARMRGRLDRLPSDFPGLLPLDYPATLRGRAPDAERPAPGWGVILGEYRIARGETLWSLFGPHWSYVYQLPVNAAFRGACPDPDRIRPGEVIAAPIRLDLGDPTLWEAEPVHVPLSRQVPGASLLARLAWGLSRPPQPLCAETPATISGTLKWPIVRAEGCAGIVMKEVEIEYSVVVSARHRRQFRSRVGARPEEPLKCGFEVKNGHLENLSISAEGIETTIGAQGLSYKSEPAGVEVQVGWDRDAPGKLSLSAGKLTFGASFSRVEVEPKVVVKGAQIGVGVKLSYTFEAQDTAGEPMASYTIAHTFELMIDPGQDLVAQAQCFPQVVPSFAPAALAEPGWAERWRPGRTWTLEREGVVVALVVVAVIGAVLLVMYAPAIAAAAGVAAARALPAARAMSAAGAPATGGLLMMSVEGLRPLGTGRE